MTTISSRPVSVPTTATTRSAATSAPTSTTRSTSAAATGDSFEASSGGGATFSGTIGDGLSALKDVKGGESLKAFLEGYPTKSGIEQAEKDLEALKGKLDPDQAAQIENAIQAQKVKLGTQQLLNSIAEAVANELKKSGQSRG